MADDAAIAAGISVYAALEADAARDAAEEAEARAFMDAYSHRTATPAERQRYVDVVQAMYPRQHQDPAPNALVEKCLGAFIVLTFLVIGGCAAYGHFVHDNAASGMEKGFFVIVGGLVAVVLLGVFAFGVSLLFGGAI